MHEAGAEQRLHVLDAFLVAILEAELREAFTALQIVHGDGVVIDLGDEVDIGRIAVGRFAEIQQVVLHGNQLPTRGRGVEDHVVRADLGLDVTAGGDEIR